MTRYLAVVLVILFFLWLLKASLPLLNSLVISALIAYILNPTIARLTQGTKIRRDIVVTVFYVVGLLVITGLLFLLIPYLVRQTQILSEELLLVASEFERFVLSQQAMSFAGFTFQPEEMLALVQFPDASFFDLASVLLIAQSISQNSAWVLVIIITTYYLLLDWPRLRNWLLRLAPPTYQADVYRLYKDIEGIWWAYLRGQLVLMFIIGVLNAIGGVIIGLPGAVALGLLGGFLSIIPTAGSILSTVAAMAVAFIQGSTYLPMSNTLFALLVLALYGAIQGLENVWLRPRVISQHVQIHPAVVFVTVMASLLLSTILVTLLISPVIGTLWVIGGYLRCRIFGLDPWPDRDDALLPLPLPSTNAPVDPPSSEEDEDDPDLSDDGSLNDRTDS